jgi:hypothetical protein
MAVGLTERFDGDGGRHHERDDNGGDPDEGLLAVHPPFHLLRWSLSLGGGGLGGLGAAALVASRSSQDPC